MPLIVSEDRCNKDNFIRRRAGNGVTACLSVVVTFTKGAVGERKIALTWEEFAELCEIRVNRLKAPYAVLKAEAIANIAEACGLDVAASGT